MALFLRDFEEKLHTLFGLSVNGIAGLVAFSPWLDLSMNSTSAMQNTEFDYLVNPITHCSLSSAWLYMDGLSALTRYLSSDYSELTKEMNVASKNNCYMSPVFARDLTGLPPTFIVAGASELLLSEAILFYGRVTGLVENASYDDTWVKTYSSTLLEDFSKGDKEVRTKLLCEHDAPILLEVYNNLPHCFPFMKNFKFEGTTAITRVSKWASCLEWNDYGENKQQKILTTGSYIIY